ncbi:MAG: stage II sporulation protein D [Candidatus Fimenecus sp.]
MRIFGILCATLALFLFTLPVLVFDVSGGLAETVKSGVAAFSGNGQTKTQNTSETVADTVTVLQAASGNVIETDTVEYLVGCLACELPPDTPTEALKAQAVAAYTNVVRLKENPDGKAGDADITDDTGLHQGYYDEQTRREKWGDKYDAYAEKFSAAVQAVYRQKLTYDGKPITAAYFALCAGRTESATNIWGGDIPYLVSVTSTGDRLSPDLQTETVLSAEEMRTALSANSEIVLGENPAEWITDLTVSDSESGVVTSVCVGGQTVTGQALRALLGLRSPAFTVSYADGSFYFTVSGSGHFVGMSQYGADYMARQGADYKEILAHYYPGTALENP